MLHGLCCGEEARARNLAFFRVKWLQATMKGTSCVRRLRLRSFGSFYAFLEAVVADRIGMAASRLLGAAAACVILMSFAAGLCKLYWSGCIKAAAVI